MAFLVANVPPVEVLVKKEYLYDLQRGHGEYEPGIWITAKSIQGRALYFETYLYETGALYDKLPISAFVWKETKEEMALEDLELWDCFSYHISVIQKVSIGSGKCKYKAPNGNFYYGEYLFTIDWGHPESNILDTEHSEIPDQHKCGHVLALDNGNYAIQPNNRILWNISNFTFKSDIPDYNVQTTEWNVENKNWITEDTDKMFYKIEDK